jgi:hypothetical protein
MIEKLCLSMSLYNPLELKEEEIKEIATIFFTNQMFQFDCYCIECKKESTFKSYKRNPSIGFPSSYLVNHDYLIERLNSLDSAMELVFSCQRNENHKYSFVFKITDSKIIKIGQYPSAADLELHKIEKYRKILKDDYRDFSKAIGLFSHGVGVGSFVYLRRIFENLIEEKRKESLHEPFWDDEEYQKSSMDEKIKLLEDKLPQILVENRKLYGILSKGIHELTEEECLSLFPNVQLAIELILDEKIYLLEQEKKIKSVKSFIAATVEKLRN